MYKTERFSESSIFKVCFRENDHRIKVEVLNFCHSPCYLPVIQIHVLPALYRKSHLCIPRNETARLIPNSCIHVSVSDLYIPRIGLPIWLQQNRQTDPGNI